MIHWLAGAYSKRVSAFGNLAVYGALPRRQEARFDPSTLPTGWGSERDLWPPKTCSGFNPVIDVEDQSAMVMELENGVLGSYMECHFTPDLWRNFTVIGDAGRLENYGDGPEDPIIVWSQRRSAFRLIGDETYHGASTSTDGGHGGADALIVKEYIAYLRGDTQTTATPEAGRMAVAAGYQATMSLRSGGGALDIPPINWTG